MRHVSLVLIILSMWWSWSIIKTPSLLSEDTHIGIQEDLRRVITEYLEDNLPNVKNIRFDKFWTQTLKENKVKATFSYTFDEDNGAGGNSASVGVAGHAILNRQQEKNNEFDVWSLDELYVDNNSISFREGVTIIPNSNESSLPDRGDTQEQ